MPALAKGLALLLGAPRSAHADGPRGDRAPHCVSRERARLRGERRERLRRAGVQLRDREGDHALLTLWDDTRRFA